MSKQKLIIVPEWQPLSLPKEGEVVSAWFGRDRTTGRDVTNQVRQLLEKEETVKASIDLFGDPNPGHDKSLYVTITCSIVDVPKGTQRQLPRVKEWGTVTIPDGAQIIHAWFGPDRNRGGDVTDKVLQLISESQDHCSFEASIETLGDTAHGLEKWIYIDVVQEDSEIERPVNILCDEHLRGDPSSLDFSALGSKKTIMNETEYQAISLTQLKKLREFLKSHTDDDGFLKHKGKHWWNRSKYCIRLETLNLYDLDEWVIKPATAPERIGKGGCSFVELMADDYEQKPVWFVSHTWAQPVMDFISCVEKHASVRGIEADCAYYWVCAYANNQHDLDNINVMDPKSTPFYKAIKLSQGVLSLLDSEGFLFTRVWCCFEHLAVVEYGAQRKLLLDMATITRDGAQILTDGLTSEDSKNGRTIFANINDLGDPFPGADKKLYVQVQESVNTKSIMHLYAEQWHEVVIPKDAELLSATFGPDSSSAKDVTQKVAEKLKLADENNWNNKAMRESGFPLRLIEKGYEINILASQASRYLDWYKIITSVSGGELKDIDEEKATKMKEDYDASEKDWFKTYKWTEEMKDRITSRSEALSCMFAEMALSSSAKVGRLEPALVRLVNVISNSKSTTLELNLLRCDINVTQTELLSKIISEMGHLDSITLNMAENNIGEEGALHLGAALGKLQHLRSLKLYLQSNNIGDNGLKSLLEGFENKRHTIGLDLLELNLENNRIGNDSLKKLGQFFTTVFQEITSMTLSLSSNNAGDIAAFELAGGLKNLLPRLTYCKIKLGFNKIGTKGKTLLSETLVPVPHFLSFDL